MPDRTHFQVKNRYHTLQKKVKKMKKEKNEMEDESIPDFRFSEVRVTHLLNEVKTIEVSEIGEDTASVQLNELVETRIKQERSPEKREAHDSIIDIISHNTRSQKSSKKDNFTSPLIRPFPTLIWNFSKTFPVSAIDTRPCFAPESQ